MGRVRTKTVKRAAKILLERHYNKLTTDFHINKRILLDVAKVPTKKLRNKIAGCATHLVKRIQRGPVKSISLKVQEEERERRLDWVPKVSEINIDSITIDTETRAMLEKRFTTFFDAHKDRFNVVEHKPVVNDVKPKRHFNRDNKNRTRPPREKREQKEGEAAAEPKPEDKVEEAAKPREGRRRIGREGQD